MKYHIYILFSFTILFSCISRKDSSNGFIVAKQVRINDVYYLEPTDVINISFNGDIPDDDIKTVTDLYQSVTGAEVKITNDSSQSDVNIDKYDVFKLKSLLEDERVVDISNLIDNKILN